MTPRTTGRERFALVAPPVGLRPPYAATSANKAPVIPVTLLDEGGPFCTPIGGPFWTPIDSEGFDDARLDTLFLTMPIAWKGTLAQYVGRLHRRHDDKKDVLVVDYVDSSVPVLARMAAKRRTGYRALGYVME